MTKFVIMFATFVGTLMLQPVHGGADFADSTAVSTSNEVVPKPHIVKLRREAVPVKHKGKVVSYRTSYSGAIRVGSPAQDFRVVFDTGSGHVILPSIECRTETCKKHRRYAMASSTSAVPINLDGSTVYPGNMSDQVTIGFGTGKVVGEFVRDRVCLGPTHDGASTSAAAVAPISAAAPVPQEPCADMHVVMAIDMSKKPFASFGFDGILGMGIKSLALSGEFSFFDLLSGSGGFAHRVPQFGVYLAGESSDESEIAFGGHNAERTLDPLSWVPAARSELGYWQVAIRSVRVAGETLDMCKDGDCFGVMDTGTSHLGIPGPHDQKVEAFLTKFAVAGMQDCRYAEAPILEIELEGNFTIALGPEDYMRQLPLSQDLSLGGAGVTMNSYKDDAGSLSTTGSPSKTGSSADLVCKPKLMAVNMPAPLGPHLFILGEPVLHRYYTAYDWGKNGAAQTVGLAMAKHSNGNNVGRVRPAGPAATTPISLTEETKSGVDDPIIFAQLSASASSE